MSEPLGPRYSNTPGPKGNRYGDWRSEEPCPGCGGTRWYLARYERLVCGDKQCPTNTRIHRAPGLGEALERVPDKMKPRRRKRVPSKQ